VIDPCETVVNLPNFEHQYAHFSQFPLQVNSLSYLFVI